MKTSPSLMHPRSRHPQHTRQQHHRHRRCAPTPSTPLWCPQRISTPPTTPMASANLGMLRHHPHRCILAANTLNTLDSNTTGTINTNTVNTLSGDAADLNTAYDSDGISNLAMKTSPSPMHPSKQTPSTRSTATPLAPSTQTPSTTSLVTQQISTPPTTPTASAKPSVMKTSLSLIHPQPTPFLNTLDGNTTGTVIDASAVNTSPGAAAELNTAYNSDGISLGDVNITLTDASLAADASTHSTQHHRHRQRRHRQHTLWCRSGSQHRLRLRRHQQPRR